MGSSCGHHVGRRDFLKSSAAGLALLPTLRFDSLGLPARRRASRVAVVKTGDRKAGVTRAMDLLGVSGADGKHVVIKPNFNSADTTPGSTHNDTLEQIVREMQEAGARAITVGESSGPGSTADIMAQKGIHDLASDHGFDVINYDEIDDDDWVHFPAAGSHWPDGFFLPRQAVNAEYLVSTCCLKTHGFGGVFTMSMKLSVGLTPEQYKSTRPRRDMHRSPDMRRMIAELNTGYRPQLIVLDGVDAFVDGGPSQGELKKADVVIAGTDRVAVDAVGLAVLKELGSNEAIMGRGIFEQEQMARAVELGLGVSGPEEIELVTGDDPSQAYATALRPILAQG